MKKKFLTFLFTICFMLPCAFIMTACGGNPPPEEPTLEGYTIFIKDEETDTFECVLGEQAIRAGDIGIVSKWSDESKNAIVPFNDFELSVSWYDWINNEDKTTLPDFWTNSTGYTDNDQATIYWFTLTKDGVQVNFSVNITQATKTNPQVRIHERAIVTTAEVEWAHNVRHQDDPTNCYYLEISGLTEEDGYNENFERFYAVEKEEYDALTTIQEKKELLDNIKANIGPCGKNLVFTNFYEPGTYYIFAYVDETNNYKYGEYGDGWIYNYATLTITEAEIEQTQQSNVINYDKDWDFNIRFDSFNFPSELPDIRDYVSGHIEQYEYIDGTWTVSDAYANTLKVPAIKDGDYYELVDLKNWQSNMQEWTVLNHNGTPAYDVDDNSKIEMVDYTKLKNYIWYDGITLPIYYKVTEVGGLYYDYSKIFKTEVTINKYKLDFVPSVTPTADNAEYGVIGKNQFEFIYDGGRDFTLDIELAYYVEGWYSYIEFQDHDETDYVEGGYVGKIVLKNPNFAWEWETDEYSSRPVTFRYTINKEKVPYPVYSTGDTDYNDYFDNYIEVEWYNMELYSRDYTIEGHIEFPYAYVNIYRYIMQTGDESITDRALMAEKIKANGVKLDSDSVYINDPDNNVPGKVIIMYELENNSVTWADEETEPVFFKFEIVRADQKPMIVDENELSISVNEEVWIEVSSTGTADLTAHILDNTANVGSSYNYYGTDAPLVFELVTSIPSTDYTTTGVGTLDANGVITLDGTAETTPIGTFCIKITKAGNDYYNDFEMYVRVFVGTYSHDADLSQYISSLRGLVNYVTTDDGYDYEGLVFEYGKKFGELYLPELPTNEYCTFAWAIRHSTGEYSILTADSELSLGENDIRILVTAKDGKKWFIDDYSDGTVDGVVLTGFGVRFYMVEAADLSGKTLEIGQLGELDWDYVAFSNTYNDGNKDYSVNMTLGEFVEQYYNSDLMKDITGATEITSVEEAKTALKGVYRNFVLANNPTFTFSADGKSVTTHYPDDPESLYTYTYTVQTQVTADNTTFYLYKEGNSTPQGKLIVDNDGNISAFVVGFTLRQWIYFVDSTETVTLTATDGSEDTTTVQMNQLNNAHLQLTLPTSDGTIAYLIQE